MTLDEAVPEINPAYLTLVDRQEFVEEHQKAYGKALKLLKRVHEWGTALDIEHAKTKRPILDRIFNRG
jgi:hypothetical protein